jgi:hypothetical protein
MLWARQILRRLHRLNGLAVRRTIRGDGLPGGRWRNRDREHGGQKRKRWESLSHRRESKALPRGGKMAVMGLIVAQAEARGASALAGLEAALGLIDDVDAALAPHEAVVAVPST